VGKIIHVAFKIFNKAWFILILTRNFLLYELLFPFLLLIGIVRTKSESLWGYTIH